jgi:hypothetical protein
VAPAFASGWDHFGGGMTMTDLENWLTVATRRLAAHSAAQVRREIQEHYESAREAAVAGGSSADEADTAAMRALGDAKTANCQYRKVLLTSGEARLRREGQREAGAICSRPWLKWLMVAAPVALVEMAAVSYFRGNVGLARDLLFAGIGMSPLFAAMLVPINTPLRGRIFRYGKWVVMTAAVAVLFSPEVSRWSWLLLSCFWPVAFTDWTRASIRRKLPVSAWPRHLYL